jgi:ABC-type phosphate transport system substrate-binding protein
MAIMKRSRKTMIAAGLTFTAALQQARADVVVIVSAQSAAKITAKEISLVYLGARNTLTPLDIAGPSVTRREFYTKVIGKDEAQVKARWSKLVFTGKGSAPRELPSGADVVKAVAADPHAIGYVDSSFVNITVKVVLKVK